MEQADYRKQAKQIVVDSFKSFYERRDIEAVMAPVDDKVRWIGSREYFVAHNKEEYKHLLQQEMVRIPDNCLVNVKECDVSEVNSDCYFVTGELELKIPYDTEVRYCHLRFSVMFAVKEDTLKAVSIHTSVNDNGKIVYGMEENEQGRIHHLAQDLEKQDRYDALTGMYTLEAFKEEFPQHFIPLENEKYAMIYTDVTHFERVNNLYGLKRSDRMLSELATLLTTFSPKVLLGCRSVADHFLLLMRYSNKAELKDELDTLCSDYGKLIAEQYADANPRLGVGAYMLLDYDEDIDSMVEHANIARKGLRVKTNENVVFYDNQVFSHIERVKKIESEMKEALKNGEFKAYLQPKYKLATDEIVGAEALCRWVREDGSMVYPDEFIPVFEEDGFIADIDFYMLDQICNMLRTREAQGKKNVSISINQSRVLLQDQHYVDKVAEVLEKYQVQPEFLELELTERIFQYDISEFVETMGRLKKLGIRWSIDDFGTGFSSLNLLKELPVDIIKIDKSFLDETESSETSKIIIRKTVELTQELDKHVVCEGVETEAQADYLRNIACDMAQGYLYAKPMPMNEFEALLDRETEK